MYGKATETAIAAMSRLAEVYDRGKTRLSAAEIAASRGLQRPFVGKVLTTLAQAGLVEGSRGPGGGYTLTRHPRRIKIFDVFRLFDRADNSDVCPFGGGVCGVGEPCPLHDRLTGVQDAFDRLLHETSFEVFRAAYQDEGRRPEPPKRGRSGSKRSSYRASRGRP